MLDLVGTILFAALAVVLVAWLVPSSALRGVERTRLAVAILAWFLVVAGLGAAGAFRTPALPVGIPVGIALLVPLIAFMPIVARTAAFGLPMATLVAVNVGRIAGVMFLLLFSAGRLPWSFAHSAGWGDIVAGATALPVAWAVHRRVPGWGWIAGIWNAFGLADLVTAVTLGVGSAPGSLLRFNFETPGSAAIATFPWVLIPAFFVPTFILVHVAIFRGLAAAQTDHGT